MLAIQSGAAGLSDRKADQTSRKLRSVDHESERLSYSRSWRTSDVVVIAFEEKIGSRWFECRERELPDNEEVEDGAFYRGADGQRPRFIIAVSHRGVYMRISFRRGDPPRMRKLSPR